MPARYVGSAGRGRSRTQSKVWAGGITAVERRAWRTDAGEPEPTVTVEDFLLAEVVSVDRTWGRGRSEASLHVTEGDATDCLVVQRREIVVDRRPVRDCVRRLSWSWAANHCSATTLNGTAPAVGGTYDPSRTSASAAFWNARASSFVSNVRDR
jgi:hypothetical protein